ncbi:MAG TPA: ABC transporter substrate-binding protein [Massilibacterium sp.]|nr:ABC transporter substrate-binding protein [Massilibacterium sp.]
MKYRTLVFLVLLLFTMSACASTEEKEKDNELKVLYNFTPETIDPHQEAIGLAGRAGITETLLFLDEDLKLTPGLAEKWQQINDTTWEFIIREEVKFHNGDLLTAKHVQKSFEHLVEVNDSLNNTLNIQKIISDGQKLTIITKRPTPTLPYELTRLQAGIVAKVADKITEPIGTGPFQFESFKEKTKLHVKRFDDYWQGKPKLSGAQFTFNEEPNARLMALQAKEVDISYQLPIESFEDVKKNKQLDVFQFDSLRIHYFVFNTQDQKFEDVFVRQAFNHLINREEIAKTIMKNQATAAYTPFVEGFAYGKSVPKTDFNLEKAEQLLKKAGYQKEDGKMVKDGQPLTFTLITYQGRPELPLIAQMLQANAKKVGIDIDIRNVENIDEYLPNNKDWGMATYSVNPAIRGEPSFFYNTILSEKGSLNFGQYKSDDFEQIVQEFNQTFDISERELLSQKAIDKIQEDVPHIYVVHPKVNIGIHQSVKNFTPGKDEFYPLNHEVEIKHD